MNDSISQSDAHLALRAVEDQRRHVLAEVDLPRWYWWGLALGWVALGALNDLGNAWAAAIATFIFGTLHAAIAPRVFSGRRKSGRLSIRRDLVTRRLPALLFACLAGLVAVTIGLGFVAHADGARHPAITASFFVALGIVAGGPQVMAAVRRRAGGSAT